MNWEVKIAVLVRLQDAVHFMRMECVLTAALLTEQPVQPQTSPVVIKLIFATLFYN